MKHTVTLFLMAILFSLVAGPALAADEAPAAKVQELCPMNPAPIDKAVFADAEGVRVYFCCPGCKAEFMKDPAKHINAMKAEGIELEKTPEGDGAAVEPASASAESIKGCLTNKPCAKSCARQCGAPKTTSQESGI